MKQILSIAVLVFACYAFAEGSYLYWMVADDAEVSGTPLTEGDYYSAKIKYGDGELAGQYLNLYENGSGTKIDDYIFEAGDSAPVWALLGDTTVGSYIVELYSESSFVGSTTLAYSDLASYISEGGMETPLDAPYQVRAFAIPEPTSGLLLLLGVAGLALRRKNKKA